MQFYGLMRCTGLIAEPAILCRGNHLLRTDRRVFLRFWLIWVLGMQRQCSAMFAHTVFLQRQSTHASGPKSRPQCSTCPAALATPQTSHSAQCSDHGPILDSAMCTGTSLPSQIVWSSQFSTAAVPVFSPLQSLYQGCAPLCMGQTQVYRAWKTVKWRIRSVFVGTPVLYMLGHLFYTCTVRWP